MMILYLCETVGAMSDKKQGGVEGHVAWEWCGVSRNRDFLQAPLKGVGGWGL